MIARSLAHYWRTNLAVLAGAAVCTAVLAGALMVGDSVRDSLRRLTTERLGEIDYALVAGDDFEQGLATRVARALADAGVDARTVATTVLRASARHAKSDGVARVNVVGMSPELFELWPPSPREPWQQLFVADDRLRPAAILNDSANTGGVGALLGEELIVALPRWSDVPRASLLGRRESTDVVRSTRVVVGNVVEDAGPGRFSLVAHQGRPSNLFLAQNALQDAVGRPGRANTLLLDHRGAPRSDLEEVLAAALQRATDLDDLGLELAARDRTIELTSRALVVQDGVVAAFSTAARARGLRPRPHLTYLFDAMTRDDRSVPYSTVAAIDPDGDAPWLATADGAAIDALAEDEVALNRWAADDLGAVVGDAIEVAFQVVAAGDKLHTERARLRVAAVVDTTGLAADRTLVPPLPGVHDARDMADWDPPFPVDFSKIRERDEDYWDEWGATPKAFVSLATGRRLWTSRFGATTAVRVTVADATEADEVLSSLRTDLRSRINPASVGLRFVPVRDQGLKASEGATDFSGLFIGFSSFLIIAAALLVALLFSLLVESRTGEIGLLLALGHGRTRVRRRFLSEGGALAALGAVLGVTAGVAYAWLLVAGLGSWWRPAVGSSDLALVVTARTLAIGYFGGFVVSLFAIAMTLRRLQRQSALALLVRRPVTVAPGSLRAARVLRNVAAVVTALALTAALWLRASTSPALFFVIGAGLLVTALGAFALWCRTGSRAETATTSRLHLALSGIGRAPGRSIISVTLIACASFVLVAVATNHREPARNLSSSHGPSGGFSLVAESEVPLYRDLADPDARFDLGFSSDAEQQLDGVAITPLRLRVGDDASCLNLYKPTSPRLLGVPPSLIARDGFSFHASVDASSLTAASALSSGGSPWQLLEIDLGPGVIPVIADAETARWILHLGLGDDLTMTDGLGQTVSLRLVAMLDASIFQSELLVAEDRLVRHFPEASGFSFFLINAPEDRSQAVTIALESSLRDYGVDVTSCAERLGRFQTVANTYLETFRLLGGLGLMLGTLGMAIILLRNALERRGELATMRAFGFGKRALTRLMGLENTLLLCIGLAIGTAAALLASAPSIVAGGMKLPWAQLAATLLTLLVIGVAATAVAAWGALRGPLLPALKGD